MKTKVLLLTVALGAAGVATSMAQVFSQNAVGYINVTIPAGKLAMVANQLNAGDNSIAAVLPSTTPGTTAYQYLSDGTYNSSIYLGAPFNTWDPDATIPMNPGKGVFILNPDVNPLTLTFVGEVPQGSPLQWNVPVNLSILSSVVPQSGGITTVLGYPPTPGDTAYTYIPATGAYDSNIYLGAPFNAWDPNEPTPAVGEAVFMFNNSGSAKTWSRTFTVN